MLPAASAIPTLVAVDIETVAGIETNRAPEITAAMLAARTWWARRRRTPTRISSDPSRGTELNHSTVRRGSGPSGMTWLTRSSEVVRATAASQSTSWRSSTTELQSSA